MTESPPPPRRPLTSRQSAWAAFLAGVLVRGRVRPNTISLLSVVFAAAAGTAFGFLGAGAGIPRAGLFLLAAAGIQLRLLCNLLDGMVAVEGGLGSKSGEVFNDLPDRIADSVILIPAGYAASAGWGAELGWSCALAAVLTAYVRLLGGATGLRQDFCGPMAKPHRMATLTVASVVEAILAIAAPGSRFGGRVLLLALVLILAGSILTAARRAVRIVRGLEAR